MSTSEYLRRLIPPGLLAAAALAVAGPASAQLVYNAGVATEYATQAIGASTTVTVPGMTVLTSGAIAVGTASTTATLTFTLPSGVSFSSPPTPAVTCAVTGGVVCSVGSVTPSGGTLTVSVTYSNVPGPAGTAAVTIGPFNGVGFTALSSPFPAVVACGPATALQITETSPDVNFNPAGVTNKTGFACSESALAFTTSAPSTATLMALLQIDVASPSLGKQFKQGGADTLQADDGGVSLGTVPGAEDQTGTTQFQFGANTATVTLSGNFSNIASAYIAPFTNPATTTCSTTAPSGAIAGTVTGSTITFTGIAVPSTTSALNPNTGELCLTATNTGVIGANPMSPPYLVKTAVVTTTQQSPTAPLALLTYTYNGSVQQVLYTGTFPPYAAYIRITNNTSSAATVVAAVQTELGSTGSTTIMVPASNNVLQSASSILTMSGVTLDSTGRANILFLTPGFACLNNIGGVTCPVSVSQLLVNPSGDVVQLGSGESP
jgi:hypothetical protein